MLFSLLYSFNNSHSFVVPGFFFSFYVVFAHLFCVHDPDFLRLLPGAWKL